MLNTYFTIGAITTLLVLVAMSVDDKEAYRLKIWLRNSLVCFFAWPIVILFVVIELLKDD